MEAPAIYGPDHVRPRLTVVRDGGGQGRFSALPHDLIRRADLSRDARLLVAVLQMYGWNGGECSASHETMAADMGCSTRMLRTYLNELICAGIVTEHGAGARRQKVYRLVSIGSTVPIETANEKPASDSMAVNRKFSTVQSEISDTGNRKPVSDSKKKTPEKKTKEEDLPPSVVDAAGAAQPATEAPKASTKSRGTRCPETFDLSEKHLAYAATLGFTPDQARAETDKFLAHHRFKGTVGVDWYAGWQNWLRKALTFAAQQPPRNGTPRPPHQPAPRPAPSSKPTTVRTY